MATPPAPFVVGSGRCGTTLLRLMLDAHPDLAIPPETHFIPEVAAACAESLQPAATFIQSIVGSRTWEDLHLDPHQLVDSVAGLQAFRVGTALRTVYELYAARFQKTRWGDKTPMYFSQMSLIQQLLPEARFIHLIRDGRDVALSLAGLWFGPRVNEDPAEWWINRIRAARAEATRVPHYLEIRYEDLVSEPEATLRLVCRFIDLPWSQMMLEYYTRADERLVELDHPIRAPDGQGFVSGSQRVALFERTNGPPDTTRIGRWRTEMPSERLAAFEYVAGDLLSDLGYEVGRISNGGVETLNGSGAPRAGSVR